MSRKPNLVKSTVLEALKEQVKARTTLECNSFADMQLLQQDIRKVMNENLSMQTLNRLFGIIRNDFNPSLHTLDVFAKYLQYSSFHEFARFNDKPLTARKEMSFGSVFIHSLFSSIDPNQSEHQAMRTMIRNILHIVNDNSIVSAFIYPAMASTAFGRKHFFERHINMDALSKHYGDGLSHYILYSQKRQDLFFANLLYCLRYFLTTEHELFDRYFALANRFTPEEMQTFEPYHIGIYIAVKILNQSIQNRKEARSRAYTNWQDDDHLLPGKNTHSDYMAWYQIIESLVLTGDYEKAWQLLTDNLQPDDVIKEVDDDFVTRVNIFRLISGFYSGHIGLNKARQIFSEVNAKPLKPIVQTYFAILLCLLKKDLFGKAVGSKEMNALLGQLIEKTGFFYFLGHKLNSQKMAGIN